MVRIRDRESHIFSYCGKNYINLLNTISNAFQQLNKYFFPFIFSIQFLYLPVVISVVLVSVSLMANPLEPVNAIVSQSDHKQKSDYFFNYFSRRADLRLLFKT